MNTADAPVVELSSRFLQGYLEIEPVRATEAGEHRYDHKLPDMSEQGERDGRAFVERISREAKKIDKKSLTTHGRIDLELLELTLAYWAFAQDELREPTWNPLIYTGVIGDGLDPLLSRNYASASVRAKALSQRLLAVPEVLQAGKSRLQQMPKVHLETALSQTRGLLVLCSEGLVDLIKQAPEHKADIEQAARTASSALKSFEKFLEGKLQSAPQDELFRLGRAKFEKKLRFTLDDQVDIDALARDARTLLDSTIVEMAKTAVELFAELFPNEKPPVLDTIDAKKALIRRTLAKLAEERPNNRTIVADADSWLKKTTEFVKKHNLVRVPDEPCRVIEMPEYRRGVAVAYCDASGPLEQHPETFYAIAPTPSDWPAQRVESFYKEYNQSMLADLTIHEAMPGHFLQLMHNNTFSSKLRSVFSSGPFVEGWAVYSEWLMAHYGFGGPKVRMQRQKMVLRLAANAILDHDVHAGSMTEKQALDLMMNEAFQEEGEATGKWTRARLTSAQLSTYFYGFAEMMKLRKKAESEPGFSERAYHDRLLGGGSPSMRQTWAMLGWSRP